MSNTNATVSIEMIDATTREGAQKALDLALATQKAAQGALNAAKESQRAATVAVNAAKNELMAADGVVLLAKAELARLGGPLTPAPARTGTGQSEVQQAVRKVLQAAGKPLTVDEVYKGVQAEGVTMAGANPRDNLAAYIARWSKIPEFGIENKGRGLWGAVGTTAPAEVPAFLAPTSPVTPGTKVEESATNTELNAPVPDFLAPATEVIVTPEQDSDDAEETALPDAFPGRQALVDAGYKTLESLTDKTHDQLRRIKGVGAQTARDILAALEA